MNDHYYSQTPTSEHRYAVCTYAYRGVEIRFTTDAGVFSRGEIDFGTDVLLRALPKEVDGRVLDLGCGWGAIGVSVGKRYPDCEIVMSDVNERAVALTQKNAAANGVQVQALQSDGLSGVPGNFDVIITNPPIRAGKQVIYRMFAECAARLSEQGALYIVIRKQQGAESAVKFCRDVYSDVDVIEKSGGFWVIRCRGGNSHAI